MDFGIIDITHRSRITLLNMLDSRGYNTDPFRKFDPKQIEQMIGKDQLGGALRMDLTRKTDAPAVGEGEPIKCSVLYSFARLKQTLPKFLEPFTDGSDWSTTEVIVVVYEPVVDAFHTMALKMWKDYKLRIRFFETRRIVNDPSAFNIVPKHEKVTTEETQALIKELYLQSKSQLPIIRFHEDMQARWLGLMPGEVVKITRPSPSAGEYIVYRICAP
jgi:DNA-directed RNA polymerase subunit H (RpoH/RPB5)